MKKLLANFSQASLSKEQMKSVNGGKYQAVSCSCNGGGGFQGAYEFGNDLMVSINYYCGGSATCTGGGNLPWY